MPEDRATKKLFGLAPQPVERQFQELLRRINRDGLINKIPFLNDIIKTIPAWPSKLRDHGMQRAITSVATYDETLAENPFHAAPTDRIDGPANIGEQKRDLTRIGIDPIELCGNLAVIGGTGSGKTAFLENNLASLDKVSPETQQCFYDPKRDWVARAARNNNTIFADEELPLNILIPPEFMTKEAYHALFVRKFCDAYYGGFHMQHVITEAINDAFTKYPMAQA